jgi:hypothetical protein
MTHRTSSRQNWESSSRRISTSDSWAPITYQCTPQRVQAASKCGIHRQRNTKMKNSRHYRLHLQCRDHILAGRPLLSFLPLHNVVIWSSLSYNLSIALILSLAPYVVRMSYIVPECYLVAMQYVSNQHKSVGRNNILVSENPKKDGIQVLHM